MSKTSDAKANEAAADEARLNETKASGEKASEIMDPTGFKDALIERQNAALRFMGAQAASPKWMVLPGSRPVLFSELRGDMCRWPIGDSRHQEGFRFCGCSCLSGDSYCAAHKKMAFAPGKASRSVPIADNSPARPRTKAQGQT